MPSGLYRADLCVTLVVLLLTLVPLLFSVAASTTSESPLPCVSTPDSLCCFEYGKPDVLWPCRPRVFIPTDEWRRVPRGLPVPLGLWIRIDLTTGQTTARTLPSTDSNNIATRRDATNLHPSAYFNPSLISPVTMPPVISCDRLFSSDILDAAMGIITCRHERDVKSVFPYLSCHRSVWSDPGSRFTFPGAVFTDVAKLIIRNQSSELHVTLPLSSFAIDSLQSMASQSSLGVGQRELLDGHQRSSREISHTNSTIIELCRAMSSAMDGMKRQLWPRIFKASEEASATMWQIGEWDYMWRLQLHKLLVYEPGDFFAVHRDTYKQPGQVATVIVLLPTSDDEQFEGGKLLVTRSGNKGETVETVQWNPLDLSDSGDDLTADGTSITGSIRLPYIAFYSDCQHELTPLRSGRRAVLVFNLIRTIPSDTVAK